jgi:uncharacterized protein involved in exopolysaccharide biosynthesis
LKGKLVEAESSELSLADLVSILRGSWKLFAALSLLGIAAGVAIAVLTQPIYRAEVLLSPAATETGAGSTLSRLAQQFSPLTSLVGGFDNAEGLSSKEVRIATLRSRRLTDNFIRERNLLPVLFPDNWDAAARRWKVHDGMPAVPTMDAAFKRFDKKIRSVDEDRSSGLITLRVEWSDRRLAAEWANDLVARTNQYLRARSVEEAKRSIAYLEGELEKTNVVERRQIMYRLVESKTSEIMMANARDEYAFIVVDPAVIPAAGNTVKPRRVVIVALGLFGGVFIGFIVATIRWARRRGSPAASA